MCTCTLIFEVGMPGFSGCISKGDILEEALQKIREAIELCLKYSFHARFSHAILWMRWYLV